MYSTKTIPGSYFHLISGLLLIFSVYRIWDVYYAPKLEIAPVETVAPPTNSVVPGSVVGSSNGRLERTSSLPDTPPKKNFELRPFDVASLVGLNIGDIKKRLGNPLREIARTKTVDGRPSSSVLYQKSDQNLAINFEAATGQVLYFTLSTTRSEGVYAMFLAGSANLVPNRATSNYYLELMPVFTPSQMGPRLFRSIRIRPTSDPTLKGRMIIAPEAQVWMASQFPNRGGGRIRVDETSSPKFDVPKLMHMNIEQIKAELGTPISNKPNTENNLLWESTFQQGVQQLLIRYNPQTQRVVEFYIPSANPDGYTSSSRILSAVQIPTAYSRDYKVLWHYKPGSQHVYKGAKIIPTIAFNSPRLIVAPKPAVSFDIPALIGLDMLGIRAKLGASAYRNSPPPGTSTWIACYYQGDDALFVNYNLQTNQVSDFILSPRKNRSDLTRSDIQTLMERGNLQMKGGRYEFQWLSNPTNRTLYEGIKITPLREQR